MVIVSITILPRCTNFFHPPLPPLAHTALSPSLCHRIRCLPTPGENVNVYIAQPGFRVEFFFASHPRFQQGGGRGSTAPSPDMGQGGTPLPRGCRPPAGAGGAGVGNRFSVRDFSRPSNRRRTPGQGGPGKTDSSRPRRPGNGCPPDSTGCPDRLAARASPTATAPPPPLSPYHDGKRAGIGVLGRAIGILRGIIRTTAKHAPNGPVHTKGRVCVTWSKMAGQRGRITERTLPRKGRVCVPKTPTLCSSTRRRAGGRMSGGVRAGAGRCAGGCAGVAHGACAVGGYAHVRT